jgi:hypothetical protein
MSEKYTTEQVFEIWDNGQGIHWEVGQDRDALNLVEIREYDDVNKLIARLTFDREGATELMLALKKYVENDENFK